MNLLNPHLAYVGHSALISAKGYAVRAVRSGRRFHRLLEDLEISQWLPADQLEDLQNRKLRLLIRHACNNVPYYRDLFGRLGLHPDDIRVVTDLQKLPVLTKADVRVHATDLRARNIPRYRLFPGWTTGSTGTPLNALRTRGAVSFELATLWRQRRWAGVRLSDRNAAVWGTIWNSVIIPAGYRSGPPFWRYNAAERQMLFSYYHMSDRTLPSYIEKLREFRPASIEGFPSTLLLVAQALRARNQTIPLKAVFTSSEPLFTIHRAIIEEAFEARVFDLYGQAERVACATECERHEGLHVNPEYGVVEILRDGTPAAPGESGEIVGTGLNNFGMPLIRYRTGDGASLSDAPCPCGRALPLLRSIDGRLADLITTPDGRRIPGDGIMGAFHGVPNIAKSQVVQTTLSTLRIIIVPENRAKRVDTDTLIRNIRECVGKEMEIQCALAETIEETPGGKSRWVVSQVPGGAIRETA